MRSRLARIVIGGRSFIAAMRASASRMPSRAIQRSAIQSGKDQRTAAASAGKAGVRRRARHAGEGAQHGVDELRGAGLAST